MVGEPTGGRLLTIHNLAWLLDLVGQARDAIREPDPGRPAVRGGCRLGTGVAALMSPGRFPGEARPSTMHAFLNILAATSTTTKSSHKSSGSTYTLLFIVVIFGGIYFLLIRPRQQKMRAAADQARQLSVGDEVVSAGGIYGRVVAMDADVAEVEVAPGVVMTFLRRAISAAPGGNPPSKPDAIRGRVAAPAGSCHQRR